MEKILRGFWMMFFILNLSISHTQTPDSARTGTHFSGMIGFTNNGFSIIPSFSLNSPAIVTNLSWTCKKFSFDPDIRMTPDATKGGILLWLRYRLIEKQKFGLRAGAHPAFTLVRRTVIENNKETDITEMLRFLAFEVVPSYQLTPNWGVSTLYLQGHGLQVHGPQLTRVLFLNTQISNLKLSQQLRFDFLPSVFFLYTDGYRGAYLTVTGILAHTQWPFTIQSTINQTFTSNVPGNSDFMWNVLVAYHFSKKL